MLPLSIVETLDALGASEAYISTSPTEVGYNSSSNTATGVVTLECIRPQIQDVAPLSSAQASFNHNTAVDTVTLDQVEVTGSPSKTIAALRH